MPLQFLWFDTEEMSVILFFYIFGVLFGSWAWLMVVIGPFFYIQVKRKKPRGFLLHTLHVLGFAHLKGYPGPHAKHFSE